MIELVSLDRFMASQEVPLRPDPFVEDFNRQYTEVNDTVRGFDNRQEAFLKFHQSSFIKALDLGDLELETVVVESTTRYFGKAVADGFIASWTVEHAAASAQENLS